ncbi:MAG: RDD family protein [Elusimicrobia bacterium]|nr:RDD family protein [Elusimicrobiota bacterium]
MPELDLPPDFAGLPPPGPGPSGPPLSPPPPAELRPGKFSDRFIAYVIDSFPFIAGYYVCTVLIFMRFQHLAARSEVPFILGAGWIGLCWAYQTVGNLAGGTVGKKIMGMAVVDREGRRLGWGRSMLRAFTWFLSMPLFNLGCVIALFHPESRAFHDLLSGTLVVEEGRPRSGAESWVVFLGSLFLIFGMLGGSTAFVLSQPTPKDLKAIAKARDGLMIFAQIEEKFKAENGTYTASLSEIAQTSGDVEQFKAAMLELYDPNLFQVSAGNRGYRISAAALDRKRTRVTVQGP